MITVTQIAATADALYVLDTKHRVWRIAHAGSEATQVALPNEPEPPKKAPTSKDYPTAQG